ncbi:MAG TPA: hypothetical protein VFF30_17310 [Nitrososphaerales archaeon]|nr:hypothetical protein [Nitrososphaerales archaeon]
MDPSKYKKLEEYATLLIKQGEAEEKENEYAFAIEKYLKVVDVLLVMSDAAPNYTAWVQCTGKAETLQKKVKTLIALASIEKEKHQVIEERQAQQQRPLQSGAQEPLRSTPQPVAGQLVQKS